MDPFLSLRLCLEGLQPVDCFIRSFNEIAESLLRDLLRAMLLLLLLLLLVLQAAVAVIHSNNILSIHNFDQEEFYTDMSVKVSRVRLQITDNMRAL